MNFISPVSTFVALLILLSQCADKTQTQPIPDHTDYFAIKANQTQIFRFKQLTIDAPLNIYDTIEFYFTLTTDTVTTAEKISGFYFITYNTPNRPIETMIREIDKATGFYTETHNNCRKLKALLPISKTRQWNPNLFCFWLESQQKSKVEKAHTPWIFNGTAVDSTVHILHQYDSSLIHLKLYREIYGTGYGLLFSEEINILSNDPNLDFSIPIRQRITSGTIKIVEQIISK